MATARLSLPLLVSLLCCACSDKAELPPPAENAESLYEKARGLLQPNADNEKPDYKGALALLEKAARAGHVRACVDMAGIYLEGSKDGSVKPDAQVAYTWAAKAAALGDVTADYLCAFLLLSDGKWDKAAPFLDKAIAANVAEAHLLKAFTELDAAHIRDILRIYAHTHRGRIMQQMEAQKSLDRIVRTKFNDAFLQSLTAAADAGSPDAMYLLSRYYVMSNPRLAITWLTKATQCGHPATVAKAAYTLATQYEDDLPVALRWYKLAAEAGDARAQYIVALSLLNGEGMPVNEQQGEAMLRMSAGQHYTPAVEQLVRFLFSKDPEAHANEIHAWQQVLQKLTP